MEKLNRKRLYIGICLMLLSSVLSCLGQLLLKMAGNNTGIWLYLMGFFAYGVGALGMIIAFRFGELSILHPMLSAGYILSIFAGYYILHESITVKKILGIVFIIAGMIALGTSGIKEKN